MRNTGHIYMYGFVRKWGSLKFDALSSSIIYHHFPIFSLSMWHFLGGYTPPISDTNPGYPLPLGTSASRSSRPTPPMEVSAFSWQKHLDSAPVPSSPVFPSVNQMFCVKITIKIKQILPSSKPISVKGLHLVVGLPENNWKKHRFPNLSQPPEDFACPRPLRRPWHPCPSCWPGKVSKRGAGARWSGLQDNTPTIRYTKTDDMR